MLPLGAGGVSGSLGNPGDAVLSFSISGADLHLIEGTTASYSGVWSGGPITLSGEMTVTRSAGYVSYVTMSANVGEKSWRWPPAGEDGRVQGTTVSQPFSLALDVPADYQGSEVTGSASLSVCGGVCDVYAVDFRVSVDKASTSPPSAPVVRAFAPRKTAKPGKKVRLEHGRCRP